ncbi:hypothetical protein FGO68_gene7950 [Halteria grandinella]|uniref:Uncharacterized protein n=1 Tax=Halteria grandinella TaxID=5974 RepID=A0A8J8NQ41_HALGN|nr:hypothetical protein FGO68_gene7950 [Halteria grandinella]
MADDKESEQIHSTGTTTNQTGAVKLNQRPPQDPLQPHDKPDFPIPSPARKPEVGSQILSRRMLREFESVAPAENINQRVSFLACHANKRFKVDKEESKGNEPSDSLVAANKPRETKIKGAKCRNNFRFSDSKFQAASPSTTSASAHNLPQAMTKKAVHPRPPLTEAELEEVKVPQAAPSQEVFDYLINPSSSLNLGDLAAHSLEIASIDRIYKSPDTGMKMVAIWVHHTDQATGRVDIKMVVTRKLNEVEHLITNLLMTYINDQLDMK